MELTKAQIRALLHLQRYGSIGPSKELRFPTAIILRDAGLIKIEGRMYTIYLQGPFGRGGHGRRREEYHWIAKLTDEGHKFLQHL